MRVKIENHHTKSSQRDRLFSNAMEYDRKEMVLDKKVRQRFKKHH